MLKNKDTSQHGRSRLLPLVALFLMPGCFCPVYPEITFSGDQDGFIEEGEYLATGTITIRAGKSLIFAPGCIVRFKQYAGIVVEGALRCNGTAEKPILFTSDNHRPTSSWKTKAPAPFDWNGVTLADSSSSVVLENVRVAYGAVGLDVKSPLSRVRLDQTVFTEIGRDALTCGGKTIDVKDDVPISFQQPQTAQPVQASVSPSPDTEHKQKADKPVAHEKMSGKAKLRWGLCAVGAASLVFAGYSQYGQAASAMKKANDPATTNVDQKVKQSYDATDRANIGWALFGAAACVCAITFLF